MIQHDQKNSERNAADSVLHRYNLENLPYFPDPLIDANQEGLFSTRPIHLACRRGKLEDVEALIKAGADVNAVGDMGDTALHEAVQYGHIDVVKLLLKHRAHRTRRNEFGKAPIDLAPKNCLTQMTEIFANVSP